MQPPVDQTSEKVKGISLRVIIVLAIFLVCILGLYYLTDEIVLEKETRFDESVFAIFERYISPQTTQVMLFFTFFGSVKFLLPAYLLLSLYFVFYKKNTVQSLNIAAIGISSGILLQVIKVIFQRHRPLHPLVANVPGYSYPSGHSFSSFTFAGLLMYMLWQSPASLFLKWSGSVLLFIFAVLIASSRVYLHVHYASDVLAGFFLSFVWLVVCLVILRRINKPVPTPVN